MFASASLRRQASFPELEDALESRFHLKEAVVVDSDGDEERVVRDLGAAAAFYFETTLKPEMIIGISSWSRSLFSMVETLHPNNAGAGGKVVQILGGVGNASTQYQAMLLAQRLAGLIGASPVLLQAPGVVGSAEAKAVLVQDPAVEEAARLFAKLDLALVGIGSLEPSHSWQVVEISFRKRSDVSCAGRVRSATSAFSSSTKKEGPSSPL